MYHSEPSVVVLIIAQTGEHLNILDPTGIQIMPNICLHDLPIDEDTPSYKASATLLEEIGRAFRNQALRLTAKDN